ncbi:MAG: hypothetical protein VB071_11790, partial [Lawsonibacter sp.]|nr:hypothetical protein [Lawsonibacter sp.]
LVRQSITNSWKSVFPLKGQGAAFLTLMTFCEADFMEMEEKCERLGKAAPSLTESELCEMNALFPSYIFCRRRTREIWTTCCGMHRTQLKKSEILDAAHTPEPIPYCCHVGAMSAPLPAPG